jgi:aspartate racemase
MHIGLIGGIGPAATVAYYARLVEAFKKVDLPLEVTITHADISVLAANASGNNAQAQAKVFAKHLTQLKGAGCDIAMITALTGHFCFDETQSLSTLPLINGVEVIDRYCEERQIKTLGLLGSPPVLSTHLFGLLKTPRTIVPENDLESLGKAYLEVAISGVCSEENRQKFFKAGAIMVEHQKAEAILLAGTDLGLAFDGHKPGYRVIDALELHIEALVALQVQPRT